MRLSRHDDGARAPFDGFTITLHWFTVFFIALLAATGLVIRYLPSLAPMPATLDIHRSAGAMVWLLVAIRLLWRATFARFPPFPSGMPRFQQWLARRSEHLLYALLLLQPITGLATSILLGRSFPLLGWSVPLLVPRNIEAWQILLSVHRVGAYALFAVAGGHTVAAFTHHYLLRDDVLEMMAPWLRRPSGRETAPEGAYPLRPLR